VEGSDVAAVVVSFAAGLEEFGGVGFSMCEGGEEEGGGVIECIEGSGCGEWG